MDASTAVPTGAADAASGRDVGAPQIADSGVVDVPLRPVPPWRGKAERFCQPLADVTSLDVWSDQRGVFVLAGDAQNPRIFANEGGAWRLEAELAAGEDLRLSGFAEGPLVVQSQVLCGLRLVTGGVESCSAAVNGSSGFFAVASDRAYAGSGSNILQFDGSLWTQRASAMAYIFSVWADADAVTIGSANGVYASDAGELRSLGSGPGRFAALWGGEGGRLWTGSNSGLQFRASASEGWRYLYSSQGACDRIEHIWGSGDTVFFASSRMLAVHGPSGVRTIAEWPCDSGVKLTGLWGNSPSELFVTLQQVDGAGDACGGVSLLWYDGDHLHELDGTPPRSAVLQPKRSQ